MGIFFNQLLYEGHLKDVKLTRAYSLEEWIVQQKINERKEAFIGRLLGVMYFDHKKESGTDFFVMERSDSSYMDFLSTLSDKAFFCFAEKIAQLSLKDSEELTNDEKVILNRTKGLFKNFGMHFSKGQEDPSKHIMTVMKVVVSELNTNHSLDSGLIQLKFDDERNSIQRGKMFEKRCDELDLRSKHVAVLLNLPSRTIRDFCSHRQDVPKNLLQKLRNLEDEKITEVLMMSAEELSGVK